MASTSTPSRNAPLEAALAGIDSTLRSRLIASYVALKTAHAEGRFDLAGLNAGKFCEICLRVAQKHVAGAHTPLGKKIANFADECRSLITSSAAAAPESVRVLIPRALVFIYTVRNKRGIGHVGGDVDANRIDSEVTARVADWCVCELIRVYHGLSLEEAQALVDALAVRELPSIWSVAGKKRVLAPGLTAKERALLLLYSLPGEPALAEDLQGWIEYSDLSSFRKDVLKPLHKARMLEFDREDGVVHLSPLGARHVEEQILPKTS